MMGEKTFNVIRLKLRNRQCVNKVIQGVLNIKHKKNCVLFKLVIETGVFTS